MKQSKFLNIIITLPNGEVEINLLNGGEPMYMDFSEAIYLYDDFQWHNEQYPVIENDLGY